uniref:Transposase Tc1-like domain-containing protein n=1 Tax=Seriola dumerili TaxID=41447 RepID=A0A3B4UFP7_SERDU
MYKLMSEQRVRIKALFDAGWSYRRIAKDFGCSPSTVKYTLDRHDATNSHQNRKGRGRKNKLSDRHVKHLKILSLKDRRKTSRELCDEINTTMTNGATVSSRTVRRKLGEEGLVGRIAAKTPLLKEKNRVKRLKWTKEHKKWTKEDWYKVPPRSAISPPAHPTSVDIKHWDCVTNLRLL